MEYIDLIKYYLTYCDKKSIYFVEYTRIKNNCHILLKNDLIFIHNLNDLLTNFKTLLIDHLDEQCSFRCIGDRCSSNCDLLFIIYYFYFSHNNYQLKIDNFLMTRCTSINHFLEQIPNFLINSDNIKHSIFQEIAIKIKTLKIKLIYPIFSEDIDETINKLKDKNVWEITSNKNIAIENLTSLLEFIFKKYGEDEFINCCGNNLNIVTNEDIKNYKKELQIFRHNSPKDIEQRNKLNDIQKNFIINYGRTICIMLLDYFKNKNLT